MFYQRPLFTRDPPSPTPTRRRVLYVHFRFRMNGRSHPVPIRLPWDHSGSHPVSGVKWQWSVVSDDMSHIDWNCLPRLIDWWQLMISLGTERNDKRKPRNGMEGWGITEPDAEWLTDRLGAIQIQQLKRRWNGKNKKVMLIGANTSRERIGKLNQKIGFVSTITTGTGNCLSLRERRVVITESSSGYVRVR